MTPWTEAQDIDALTAGNPETSVALKRHSSNNGGGADTTDAPFLPTELGNARRFVSVHKGKFLHAAEEGVWLEWRDGRWRRDRTGAVERAAKTVIDTLFDELSGLDDHLREKAARWALQSQKASSIRAMIQLAASEEGIYTRLDELDRDPWLLSCGNGTLDLRTGDLRTPDPVDLIALGTDVDYKPDAPRTRWEQFLEEIFAGDHELIAFVKRAYGSCLTGDTRDRALFIEWGPRYNGKTTLNTVFQKVIGDFAQVAPLRLLMRSREQGATSEIARLFRKRFVVASESADKRKLNEALVKSLTGRDRVVARHLYQSEIEFYPECKIVLYTNHKPAIDGSDGAIWDRVRLTPLTVDFSAREDNQLDRKLEAELEGVLAWAVEGCLEWQDTGLGRCDAVDQATAAYRAENDTLGTFLNECCEFNGSVKAGDLREACERYFQELGEEPPSAKTIATELKQRGAEVTRTRARGRIYRGVRLVDEGVPS